MNKSFLLFLFTLFPFLIHAQQENLEFRKDVYENKDYCETDCPKFYLEVLQVKNDSEAAKKINHSLTKVVNSHIIVESDTTYSVLKVIEALKKDAKQTFKEHPNVVAASVDSILMKKTHYTKNMLTVRWYSSVYKYGMLHESYSYHYLNLDPNTGKELELNAIIKDSVAFTDFVEKRFRKEFDIIEPNINSTGYRFDKDTFRLPRHSTIGFIKDKMVFTYNPYLIDSFAQGVTNLEIPIKEIQHLLNIPFK